MGQKETPYCKEQLLASLQEFPPARAYWVGYSGGADSTALLFALQELKPQISTDIKALHVNHGLHKDADIWQSRCEQVCGELGIKLHSCKVYVHKNTGSGLEAEARRLRYEVVEHILGEDEIFLTAHHRDDQAETLLLNLVRGSGVDGLAGMPLTRRLGKGMLARPLLEFSMKSLREYLEERKLTWLEDPSNLNTSYDRNFVRKYLIPNLEKRWPGASGRMAISARHCREASTTLAKWAEQALSDRRPHERILDISTLDHEDPQFSFMVRHWLNVNGTPSLPARQLRELARQCSRASPDKQVSIKWEGWALNLFRNRLWLQEQASIAVCPNVSWKQEGKLSLGPEIGSLDLRTGDHRWPSGIRVSSRKCGDRIRLHRNGPHKDIKDLLREAEIPPWLRTSIPVLHWSDTTIAIADMLVSSELEEWMKNHQASLHWQPFNPLLKFVRSQFMTGRLTAHKH